MAGKEIPLSLVLKAIDQVTAPCKQVNEAIASLQAPVQAINEKLGVLGKAAGVVALGAAIQGVGEKIWGLGEKVYGAILNQAKGTAELAREADKLGLKITTFQQLEYVMKRGGVSTEEFASGMQTLAIGVEKAKLGHGKLSKRLEEASPAFLRQIKQAKTTEEAFDLIAAASQRLQNPMQRLTLLQDAMGGSGTKMAAALKQGPAAIAALRQEFIRIKGGGDEGAARQNAFMSQTLVNEIGDAELAFKAMKGAAFKEMVPSLLLIATQVKEFFISHRPAIQAWAKDFGKNLPERVNFFVTTIKGWIGTATAVVEKMGGIRTVMIGLAAALGGAVLVAIKALGVALLGSPVGLIITGIALAGALIYRYWDPLKAFFVELWAKVKDPALAVWQFLKDVWLNFTPLGQIVQNWEPIKAWFVEHWDSIKAVFVFIWDWVKFSFLNFTPIGLVIKHWEPIKGWFTEHWDSIKAVFSAVWEWVKGVFLTFTPIGLIIDNWEPIKKFFTELWASVTGIFQAAWEKIGPYVEKIIKAAKWIKENVSEALGKVFKKDTGSASPTEVGSPSELLGGAPRANLESLRPSAAQNAAAAAIVEQLAKNFKLKVDFTNMPRGVKVENQSEDSEGLDVDRGFSGVGAS